MNAKEYLEYIRSLEVRLRMKEERIAQLQHDICSLQALDYAKDKITGGSPIDVSDKIARLDELIRDTNREWDELIEMREQAKTLIAKLESATQQEVLTKRYIQNKRWEQIAVEMNITWRHTFRIHRAALDGFSQKMALNVSILT
jgi:DNA-directed RNA polymerase specialized sigma subunit